MRHFRRATRAPTGMRHRITDRHGRSDAFVDEEPSGRSVLRTRDGRTLGHYDPRANATRDRRGLLVGRGDLLTRLLGDC